MRSSQESYLHGIVLIPNSGVQFVSFELNVDTAQGQKTLDFIERPFGELGRDEDGEPEYSWRLLPGWNPTEPSEPAPYQKEDDDESYSVSRQRALEPFLGRWTPVPYLRIKKSGGASLQQTYDDGPTNWARVRVVECSDRASVDEPSHIVTFAFDTAIEDYSDIDDQENNGAAASGIPYVPYTEPRKTDVTNPRSFAFVSDPGRLDRFLSDPRAGEEPGMERDYQRWVVDWLEQLFLDLHRKSAGRRQLKRSDFKFQLEHVARWIAFLHLLSEGIKPPDVRFVDTLSPRPARAPVEVDLILDVGNSRTCGLLIEDYPNSDNPSLGSALTLEMRDLSRPEVAHGDPFGSNVEFSQAKFGFDALSRDSGRDRAFFWPSPVRVGHEATRLRDAAPGGNDSICGMSSPKRYLWDVAATTQPWRFPDEDYVDDTPPPIALKIRRFVNDKGDVIAQVHQDEDLFTSLHNVKKKSALTGLSLDFTYSRSSLYAFMLAEIIWQAFCQINNPDVRGKRPLSDSPRVLRRIILSLPTAVPTREQRIMKARAQSALTLLWDLMGWTRTPPPGTSKPTVHVQWDEASCVQMVWLYGEISEKFGGAITDFYSLMGKPRVQLQPDAEDKSAGKAEPSLRIASIDIGGGTSDLMISTYFQRDDRAILPVQTFRESLRNAGDDITQRVIEQIILPAFVLHMRQAGIAEPRIVLDALFGGDRANIEVQEINKRRQFVQRVFLPAALALMSAYEDMAEGSYHAPYQPRLEELVPQLADLSAPVRAYFDDAIAAQGVPLARLEDITIPYTFAMLRSAVQDPTFKVVLENLCEAVNHFDCDVVVLSGRPTKLPGLREMITDMLAVSPDRIVPLHDYKPGIWYPFRSLKSAEIGDPKTVAVVGGMLCALAEARIQNFLLATERLQMRSTARFIGEMETDGKIKDANVIFSDADPARKPGSDDSGQVRYNAPLKIGYRQLPWERWAAAPLYRLYETNKGSTIAKPISVTLRRKDIDPEDYGDAILERESAMEELEIDSAEDARESNVTPSMVLSLHTMDKNASYWLDTGILKV